jgi:tRNA G10  N-methylase Trm11
MSDTGLIRYDAASRALAEASREVRDQAIAQIILDPFCVGGSSVVAALRLGRQFIEFDIGEKCIATTAARLRELMSHWFENAA